MLVRQNAYCVYDESDTTNGITVNPELEFEE